LSIDSANEAIQAALGRGRGDHVARTVRLARLCHEGGWRLKVNTVVTALSWDEDMRDLVITLAPERWKVFQVLAVNGQNDGRVNNNDDEGVAPLLITSKQFEAFVSRHRSVRDHGIPLIAESNDAML